MTQLEFDTLTTIATDNKPFTARVRLQEYLKTVKIVEEKKASYTDNQHRAWFLWLGMIEKCAENEGITWNNVVEHTHQLRITKEGLHEMAKQLMKALWNKTSIKQLDKKGNIDILIDHMTDLFAKVGLELPPFPSQEAPTTLDNIEKAKKLDYPEFEGNPEF